MRVFGKQTKNACSSTNQTQKNTGHSPNKENDNYITCKFYSCRYQTDESSRSSSFFNRRRCFERHTDERYMDVYEFNHSQKIVFSLIIIVKI